MWQHGEVLIAYELEGAFAMDVFDRIGEAKTSALKAGLMTGTRKRLHPHYLRAFRASGERGFLLDRRYCHDSIDLAGIRPTELHAALKKVVRHEHGKGFSYLGGAHCQAFSNALFEQIHELRREMPLAPAPGAAPGEPARAEEMERLTVCGSMCGRKPTLAAFLRESGGVYAQLYDDLTRQEATATAARQHARRAERLKTKRVERER